MGRLGINAIEFDELSADPTTLVEGLLWFRTDLKEYRVYRSEVVETLAIGDIMPNSTCYLIYENGNTNTPLTQNVWNHFEMPTATLDADTLDDFEQLAGFPDTIVYKGVEDSVFRIVSTTGLRRIGRGTNTYQMRWVKSDGVTVTQIGAAKQFELGAVDGSITMTALIDLVTDDQLWLEVRNISDNDDVRLLSTNITIK